jgi:hypothetical protein
LFPVFLQRLHHPDTHNTPFSHPETPLTEGSFPFSLTLLSSLHKLFYQLQNPFSQKNNFEFLKVNIDGPTQLQCKRNQSEFWLLSLKCCRKRIMFLNYDNYPGGEHNIYTQIYQVLPTVHCMHLHNDWERATGYELNEFLSLVSEAENCPT